MRWAAWIIVPVVLLASSAGAAEVALCRDGTRSAGELEFSSRGGLRFLHSGKELPLDQVEAIHFRTALPPESELPRHRLWLSESQRVTGSLASIEDKEVVFRVGGQTERHVPRPAAVAVSTSAPYPVVLTDDFESVRKWWKLAGGAARSDQQAASGKWALRVGAAQSAELTVPEALVGGRLDLRYLAPPKTRGVGWQLTAIFGSDRTERSLTLLLGGDAASEDVISLPRTTGWHRLSLRFRSTYIMVGVDRQLAWSSASKEPWGPLRKVTLQCVGNAAGEAGALFVDDVAIARPAEAFRLVPASPDQEMLSATDGGQLWGSLADADAERLHFQVRRRNVEWTWREVAGVQFRAMASPVQRTRGQHVRIGFFADGMTEPDEVLGVLTALNGETLTLDHAVLGKLVIDRRRLSWLRPLVLGERIELDSAIHHLGERGKRVPAWRVPAGGTVLRETVRVDAVPRAATLSLSIASAEVAEGGPRISVQVNGTAVAAMDRHLRRSSAEYRRVHLPLPADAFRVGDNTLGLRLSEGTANCLVRNIVVELAR